MATRKKVKTGSQIWEGLQACPYPLEIPDRNALQAAIDDPPEPTEKLRRLMAQPGMTDEMIDAGITAALTDPWIKLDVDAEGLRQSGFVERIYLACVEHARATRREERLIDALRKIDRVLCEGDTVKAIDIARAAGSKAAGTVGASEPCAKVQQDTHG